MFRGRTLLISISDSDLQTRRVLAHLAGRFDVPLLRLLQLEEPSLQQSLSAFVYHCRDREKLSGPEEAHKQTCGAPFLFSP